MGLAVSMLSIFGEFEHVKKSDIQTMSTTNLCDLTFKLNRDDFDVMPDDAVLEQKFEDFLMTLDLPLLMIKRFKQFDSDRKWQILCVGKVMTPKLSATYYIKELRDINWKLAWNNANPNKLLKSLEISLRTYRLDWIDEFLNDRHRVWNIFGSLLSTSSQKLSPSSFKMLFKCILLLVNTKQGSRKVVTQIKFLKKMAQNLQNVSPASKFLIIEIFHVICVSPNGHFSVVTAFEFEKKRFLTLLKILQDPKLSDMLKSEALALIYKIVQTAKDPINQISLHHEFNQLGINDVVQEILDHKMSTHPQLVKIAEIYQRKSMKISDFMDAAVIKDEGLKRITEVERDVKLITEKLTFFENDWNAVNDELDGIGKDFLELLECHDKMAKSLKFDDKAHVQRRSIRRSTLEIPDPSPEADVSEAPTPPPLPTPPASVFITPTPPPLPKEKGRESSSSGVSTISIKKPIQSKVKLPTLNWTPIRPSLLKGTIFTKLDDHRVSLQLDFDDFQEHFKIGEGFFQDDQNFSAKRFLKFGFTSLLDKNRIQNVAISMRKLNTDIVVIEKALKDYDLDLLNLEQVELLKNITPKEDEVKLYKNYLNDKRDINLLGPEDKFLLQLTRIEKFNLKLEFMLFLGTFEDRYNSLDLDIQCLSSASDSLKNSEKFKTILAILLSFGNFLNSSKLSGPAYGFKMQILNVLGDVKTSDRKMSLLEYIVTKVVPEKFPELLELECELMCIEKASRISLNAIKTEIEELAENMKLIKKEKPDSVKKFLSSHLETFKKLQTESKTAETNYKECVEYFGETIQTMDSNEFFTIIWNFIKNFKMFVVQVKKNASGSGTSIVI